MPRPCTTVVIPLAARVVGGQRRHVLAVRSVIEPRVGQERAREGADQRGLAHAVAAEHAQNLARRRR